MTLDEYLTANKITNGKLADDLAVSREAVRRYRSGERRPEWEVLSKIMALTAGQVTPNDFLPALPPEPLATPAPSEAAG